MKKYLIMIIGIFMFSFTAVNAQTYTNTNNTFESTTTQQLFNIALTRDKDFLNKNFVIFQSDTSYYLIAFKDYTFNNNTLIASDTFIVRYYRESNYNSTYRYQITNESSTSFISSYIYVSNLNINNASGSPTHKELLTDRNITYLLMLILALIFASFLLKERSSY